MFSTELAKISKTLLTTIENASKKQNSSSQREIAHKLNQLIKAETPYLFDSN